MRKFIRAKRAAWFLFAVLLAVGSLAAQQSTSSSDDDKGKILVEPIIVNYLVKTYSQDPDADTKKLVEGTCGSCHGMDIVASAQKTKDEWTGVVREMISYGADIKESQIAAVAEYLVKNYGPKK